MPFRKDPGPRESERYCSYCYRNGQLCYQGHDVREFQRLCYQAMVSHGMNRYLARFYSWLVRFAPRWRGGKGE